MACKTYCWSLGTTSFRTKNFIYSIERQLQLLDEFWTINPNIIWDRKTGQPSYYEFLKSNNFVSGDAARKDKDARQKTSGLVDIGLLDKKTRHLTDVGKKILNISKENNFSKNNILNIPNDSYVYLLQFLKFCGKSVAVLKTMALSSVDNFWEICKSHNYSMYFLH